MAAVSAFERSRLLRRAAELLREPAATASRARHHDWSRESRWPKSRREAAARRPDRLVRRRRSAGLRAGHSRRERRMSSQMVVKEPVGPVAAFSPWNFPINQAVRKMSAALAAGCSIILKCPEETPASCAALVSAFADAGAAGRGAQPRVRRSRGDLRLSHSPCRRSGKSRSPGRPRSASSSPRSPGAHMKRVTMELGGHAPAIVFEDADVDRAVKVLPRPKFRNAGQICVAPDPRSWCTKASTDIRR